MRLRGLVLVLLFGCASARVADDPMAPVSAATAAMMNADLDAFMAQLHDDATVFMPFDSLPRRLEGREAIRAAFAPFFEQLRKSSAGPPYMRLAPLDVETQRHGDTAIVTFHLGREPVSEPSMFSRRTFVVTRVGGRWRIAHLHASNMRLQPPQAPR
jgi:uncharacterized protein (TIGR02246 family)